MQIVQSPSNNYSESTHEKIGVQIHKTLGLMPGTLQWLRSPTSWVGANYLIERNGIIHQMIPNSKRAWAAGRINNPTERGKHILKKDVFGMYIKPGHYLIQIEYECLGNQSYTEDQYQASVELFRTFPFQVNDENLITHRDTAIDKPLLETERTELLRRLHTTGDSECTEIWLDSWSQFGVELVGGRIHIFKR